jgi:hypothetical protein
MTTNYKILRFITISISAYFILCFTLCKTCMVLQGGVWSQLGIFLIFTLVSGVNYIVVNNVTKH